MSTENNGHDKIPEKEVLPYGHYHLSSRRKGYGRRRTDEPQVTFSKKLLVIVVALVNAVFWLSDKLVWAQHLCP